MQYLKAALLQELIFHFTSDTPRIDHALQVTGHAEALLAETPQADPEVVLAAAVMHDFGIREAERLHGRNDGPMQEKYGPPLVHAALKRIGMSPSKIREVCAIVARHHSPPRNPSINFLLLYESDWLVNLTDFPKILSDRDRLDAFIQKNFHTPAGKSRARQIFLGEDSIFAHMGNVYALMIDEEKRRAVEEPYLLALAEEARRAASPRKRTKNATRILDLACGTGFHARLMAQAGYPVTAIDFSHSMLTEARKRDCQGITYLWGDLLKPLPLKNPAPLTLILGNTLSVFGEIKQLRTVLQNAATATRPGGIVLCQILNYARFAQCGISQCGTGALAGRFPPPPITKSGLVDGRNTILTKSLQMVDEKEVLLTFTASQQEAQAGEWRTTAQSTLLHAWDLKEIKSAARRAKLEPRQVWGSLKRENFDEESSPDLVIEFQICS